MYNKMGGKEGKMETGAYAETGLVRFFQAAADYRAGLSSVAMRREKAFMERQSSARC